MLICKGVAPRLLKNLLEKQILGSSPDPLNQKVWERGLRHLPSNRVSIDSGAHQNLRPTKLSKTLESRTVERVF